MRITIWLMKEVKLTPEQKLDLEVITIPVVIREFVIG